MSAIAVRVLHSIRVDLFDRDYQSSGNQNTADDKRAYCLLLILSRYHYAAIRCHVRTQRCAVLPFALPSAWGYTETEQSMGSIPSKRMFAD